jgi:hypothetical protein
MKALEQEIHDVAIGDDWPIERTYPGAPAGTVINRAVIMIKESKDDADVDAKANIEITDSSSASGQITDTGASGSVKLKAFIPATATVNFQEREYFFDIRLFHASGHKGPREAGSIFPIKGVNQS